MQRSIFLVLTCVLALALASFVNDSVTTHFPRSIAFVLIAVIVAGWVVVLWRLLRSTPMSNRAKAVAWLGAAALICSVLSLFNVGLSTWPGFLTSLAWRGFWLTLAFMFVVAARLVVPKQSFPARTPFTIESESPSHVTSADDA